MRPRQTRLRFSRRRLENLRIGFYANLERGNKGVSISVLYDLANCLGVSVDYLIYPNQADARIRNLETLLRDKPESFIIAVERLVQLCIEEFSKSE